MRKKTNWFCWIKGLFIVEKPVRWRWAFPRPKYRPYHAIAEPQRTLSEATEEQRNYALAVAAATAAAAEAAVAAANAAAEIVRLTSTPQELEQRYQEPAAIKIQAAYRGHLGRKALRALKGVVRLQALVRGQIVRCRNNSKFMALSSLVKKQIQAQQARILGDETYKVAEVDPKEFLIQNEFTNKETKLEHTGDRSWDYSLFTKEEMKIMWLRKQEAIAQRERMKNYSLSHQERQKYSSLEESKPDKCNASRSNHLEKWRDAGSENFKSSVIDSNTNGMPKLRFRNSGKEDSSQELNPSFSFSRRSFYNTSQMSIGGHDSLPNSPVFPKYMSATKSAKAKARSASSPKQRIDLSESTYSAQSSAYNPNSKPSSWACFSNEVTNSGRKSFRTSQEMPINLKGLYEF